MDGQERLCDSKNQILCLHQKGYVNTVFNKEFPYSSKKDNFFCDYTLGIATGLNLINILWIIITSDYQNSIIFNFVFSDFLDTK